MGTTTLTDAKQTTNGSTGLFTYWRSYGLRDCLDGSSNTVAFGEMLVSSTIANFSPLTAIVQLSSIPGTALILDARTSPSAVQQGITACNTAYNTQSGKISTGIGNYWMHGSQGQTMFNTIVTPNSKLSPWAPAPMPPSANRSSARRRATIPAAPTSCSATGA